MCCLEEPQSEKNKGGWKTQGRGKHTTKPLPKIISKNPTYDMIPPPLCSRPVISLEGRAQTRPIPLSEPSKAGFGGRSLLCVHSPLPPLVAPSTGWMLYHLCFTPSAIGSAIGRPLSRPVSHPNTCGSPQAPRSKPLTGLNRAIVLL